MSTAQLGWSVNDAEVLKSFQKQQLEVDKLKKKFDDLNNTTKRHHDDTKKGFASVTSKINEGVASLGKMALSLFTVDRAIGVVTAEYEDWIAQSQKLADNHDHLHKSIIATLSAAGQLAHAADFEERARSVPGATASQFRTAFGAIQQSAPGLGYERQVELATQAAPLAVLGVDMQQFGAALGDIAEANPQKTAKDLVDLADAVRRMTGDKFGEISGDSTQRIVAELQGAGMEGTRALGLMVAGRQANLSPKTMETLALALASQEGPKGGKLTADDRLNNKFLAIQGPEARLAALQGNAAMARAVLGDGYDTRLGLLTPAAIAGTAGELARPAPAAGQIAALPASRAGAEAGMEQFLTRQDDQQRERAEREAAVKAIDRFLVQQGYWMMDRNLAAASIRLAPDPEQAAIGIVRGTMQGSAPQDEATQAIWREMLEHLRNLDAKSVRSGPAINAHNEAR